MGDLTEPSPVCSNTHYLLPRIIWVCSHWTEGWELIGNFILCHVEQPVTRDVSRPGATVFYCNHWYGLIIRDNITILQHHNTTNRLYYCTTVYHSSTIRHHQIEEREHMAVLRRNSSPHQLASVGHHNNINTCHTVTLSECHSVIPSLWTQWKLWHMTDAGCYWCHIRTIKNAPSTPRICAWIRVLTPLTTIIIWQLWHSCTLWTGNTRGQDCNITVTLPFYKGQQTRSTIPTNKYFY